jgi:hypothetical protein
MKCVIGILLGLLSSQSHAQTDGFISPGDLAAAEAAQAEQERKDRLMWVLFDALDAVKAIENAKGLDVEFVQIDIDPFVKAGKLLYDGPWVSERFAVTEDFLKSNPDSFDPSVKQIIQN